MDSILVYGFAIFLFVGGFIGSKAGSKVSLLMGLISGFLVLLGGYFATINLKGGYFSLTVVGLLLSGTFIMRLLKTKKFMPSGMLLVVALSFGIFYLIRFLSV